jgi:1-deoxy-D-xylulose-5-phosphate reductoisomerase
MKAPIAYALTYPERIQTGVKHLDLTALSGLSFFNPDHDRFPALRLAYRALESGESMPAVLNAANEVAVEAFLTGRIRFTEIPVIIERTMDAHDPHMFATIEDVLVADRWGRGKARELLGMNY